MGGGLRWTKDGHPTWCWSSVSSAFIILCPWAASHADVALVSKRLLLSLLDMVQMWMWITTSLLGSPAPPCDPSPHLWSVHYTSVLPTTTFSASGCCSRLEPTQILIAVGRSTSKASLGAHRCVWWMLSCGTAVMRRSSTSWLTLEPTWTWWRWRPWNLTPQGGSKSTLRLCKSSKKHEVSGFDLLWWLVLSSSGFRRISWQWQLNDPLVPS